MDISPNDPALLELQQRMAALYLHQQAQGGIIDLEEEKNKFLVSSHVSLYFTGDLSFSINICYLDVDVKLIFETKSNMEVFEPK